MAGLQEMACAKKPRLGSGARFRAVAQSAEAHGAKDGAAVAGAIGKRKYGMQRMAQMSAAGKRRHGG